MQNFYKTQVLNVELQKNQRSFDRGKQILLLLFILSSSLTFGQNNVDKAFVKAKEEWLTASNLAEESFRTLVKSTNDPEILAQSYYYLGDLYHARGDFNEAIANNKKVLGFKLPSKILKYAKLNGDHLKHLACSALADLYLSVENFDEALLYLKLETTEYSIKNSKMVNGPFQEPYFAACFTAKRWASAYVGQKKYDSALLVLLPYAFGEEKINRLVFEKFCEAVPKVFSSKYNAEAEVNKMIESNPQINNVKKTIDITFLNKRISIPNDDSLSLYLINKETLKDFLFNSNPIKFLLTGGW